MIQDNLTFKTAFTLKEREGRSVTLFEKYPEHLPIICERNHRSKLNHLPKVK